MGLGLKVKGEKEGTFVWPSAVALATSSGLPYKVGKEMEVKAHRVKRLKGTFAWQSAVALAISPGWPLLYMQGDGG